MKKRGCWITAAIGIAIVGLVAYAINARMSKLFTNVTDVGRYESLIGRSDLSGANQLFPETIPLGANDIFFFHCPGALQAFTTYALRCRVGPSELKQIEKALVDSGRKVYEIRPEGYLTNEYAPTEPGGVRLVLSGLPKGFVVYMSEDEYRGYKAMGNHGTMGYAAISHATGEVVFYFTSG